MSTTKSRTLAQTSKGKTSGGASKSSNLSKTSAKNTTVAPAKTAPNSSLDDESTSFFPFLPHELTNNSLINYPRIHDELEQSLESRQLILSFCNLNTIPDDWFIDPNSMDVDARLKYEKKKSSTSLLKTNKSSTGLYNTAGLVKDDATLPVFMEETIKVATLVGTNPSATPLESSPTSSSYSSTSFTSLYTLSSQHNREKFCNELRKMDLSYNHLSMIPSSITSLKNLRELNLSNNIQMVIFPIEICKLKKLEVLDISNTQISKFPTQVVELHNLQVLDWNHTPLCESLLEIKQSKIDLIYEEVNAEEEEYLRIVKLEEDALLREEEERLKKLKDEEESAAAAAAANPKDKKSAKKDVKKLSKEEEEKLKKEEERKQQKLSQLNEKKQLFKIKKQKLLANLKKTMLQNYEIVRINDLFALKNYLNQSYRREKAKNILLRNLLDDVYLPDADKVYTVSLTEILVEALTDAFTNLEDFEFFSNRPRHFVPDTPSKITNPLRHANQAVKLFYEMKRDTERKRLSADLEIKIRAIYFDKINREDVPNLLDAIMSHVKLLEDVQFLIQYATQIFPPNVERVLELDAGALILENIEKLQAELTRMRENSINALYSAITQLYPEQEPEKLFNTAVEVSKLFQKERFATKKEILKMTQLTSDCSKVFPTDFAAIDYNEILQLAKEKIFSKL